MNCFFGRGIKEIFATTISLAFAATSVIAQPPAKIVRERISINKGWKFYKYDA